MTSEKQLQANRRNAQKSTDHVTEKGKAVVALNAVKHGILTNRLLVKEETQEEFGNFESALLASLTPIGSLEEKTHG